MTDDKDKHSQEEPDLEKPDIPDTDGLSLVEDDKLTKPPVDDFDFDLDLDDGIDANVDDDDEVRALEIKLMGGEYAEPFPEPAPEESLSEDYTGHIEDKALHNQTDASAGAADFNLPEDAEVEVIEESYLDAPFADEPDDPHEEFTPEEEIEEDEELESADQSTQQSSILHALAKPENAVKQAFQNSNIRQNLLENNEWYRARDENQRMEDEIEETYGGASEQGINPGSFFRNNILTTLLIVIIAGIVIRLGIGVYFPDLLPDDDSADKITASTTAVRKKAKSVPGEKVIKVNYLNKAKIDSFLQHCLILPDSRQLIDQRFAKTGYEFTDQKLTLAHEELQNFINVYDQLEITSQVQDAVDRIGMLSHAAMPIIYQVRDKVSDYHDDIDAMRKQANGIRTQLETLSIGRQDTATVNQQIKLRSDLDKLNDKLAKGPSEEEFTSLDKILEALDKGLTSQTPLQRLPVEDPAEELPYWYASLPDSDTDNFKMALKETVLPEIALHGNALSPALAELSRFHVREMTITLEELYLVASRIMYAPENLLDIYNKDIHGADNRLNNLLGSDQSEWLSFAPCLQQARHEIIN